MTFPLQSFQRRFEKALLSYVSHLPNNNLHAPVSYILSLGGKRIRPTLVMLSAKAFGAGEQHAVSAALAVELFHNFSLVHDDIMDRAPTRRGKDTVHKKWSSDAAILSGDAMLIEAYKQLACSSGNHLPQLFKLFNDTAMEVCEGQQMDMDFETREDVKTEQYLEMISLKTAVLIGCSLKMGAILGDSTEGDAQHIYEFGKLAGIAFQLQDDYLDAFGDPENFGKQVGGDIILNKKTFLFVKALQKADEKTAKKLKSIYFNESISDQKVKVQEVLTIFRDLDIEQESKRETDKYFQRSAKALENVSIADDDKDLFREFIGRLQARKV